jgi:hypothetical protein
VDEPDDGAFDWRAPAAVGGLPSGLVAVWWPWWGRTVKIRPCWAVVQRSRSGQPVHTCSKTARRRWWIPVAGPRGTLCPAGQVTGPARVSIRKSSRPNPPGIAVLTGGLEEQPVATGQQRGDRVPAAIAG